MKISHKNCQDTKCPVCFADAMRLERLLSEKTGTGRKYDLLGKYHKWQEDNYISAETKWGWPSMETYADENIENFCKWFREELSKRE